MIFFVGELLSCLPSDPVGQGTELNWSTVLSMEAIHLSFVHVCFAVDKHMQYYVDL